MKRLMLLAGLLSLLFIRNSDYEIPSLPSFDGVVYPSEAAAPPDHLQALVRGLPVGGEKAAELSRFYSAFSTVAERDGGKVLTDTLTFAKAHRNALTLYGFSPGPAVGEQIDKAIADHLGVEYDEEGYVPSKINSDKLVEVLNSLSWAFGR